jgi:hypothetical protein
MADNGHHVKRRFLANMLTCPQKTMNGGKQLVAEVDKLLAVMLMFTMLQQMLNSFSNTVKSLITTGIYTTGLSRFFLLALLALALTSCAQHHRLQVQPSGPLSDCQSLFVQVDEEVKRANVQDYGPMRISGFPYLRVDRFSASFRESASGSTQMQTWTKRLAELDAEARGLELRNLGQPVAGLDRQQLESRLDSCRAQLVDNLMQEPAQLDRLRQEAVVPDDYVTGWRAAGLYPLTSLVVLARIHTAQEEMQQIFAQPLDSLPIRGRIIRWREPPAAHPLPAPPSFHHDALGIPQPSAQLLRQLFRSHAPIWEVDAVDDNDLIGTPVWRQGPAVDTGRATEYHQLSYARLGDRVLLQLNYIIWFKARPGNDIYAGQLDGLIWRVTLGPDGAPVLYDSIHNCGCYLNFFPTASLHPRQDLPRFCSEPLMIPQQAPLEPLVVRLDHGRHFIERVYTDTSHRASRPLATVAYDQLRSLPTATGYHNLFGRAGLIPGSERPERFILWPMGIRSPGAMRQWGHHAIAFVGRRHFDDPWLLQSLFEWEPQ